MKHSWAITSFCVLQKCFLNVSLVFLSVPMSNFESGAECHLYSGVEWQGMRNRTSGDLWPPLRSHRRCRSLMTSRVPRWWIRPIYNAGIRLDTSRRTAAGFLHVWSFAKDMPANKRADVDRFLNPNNPDWQILTAKYDTERQHGINEAELFVRKETAKTGFH